MYRFAVESTMRSVFESVNVFHVVCTNAVLHLLLASSIFRIFQSKASRKHITCMSRKTDPNSESKKLNVVKNLRKMNGKVKCTKRETERGREI